MKDKRLQKQTRHFAIRCDGAKVNLLNWRLNRGADGGLVLELVTKIRGPALTRGTAEFELDGGNTRLLGTWVGEFHQPGVSRYYYRVEGQIHRTGTGTEA